MMQRTQADAHDFPSRPAPNHRRPDLHVVDADPADLPGILAITNQVIAISTAIYTSEPATLEERTAWFTARRARGFPVLVARDATGGVAGFASFGDFRAWPGYANTVEHSVHIRADARGHGLGAMLVQALLPRAADLGMHVMIAGVDAENAASLRLHEKLGFVRVAHLREVGRKFDRWLDLVFLQRWVDAPGAPR
jgi:phosphinothricin acetyltransferase